MLEFLYWSFFVRNLDEMESTGTEMALTGILGGGGFELACSFCTIRNHENEVEVQGH